MKTISFICLMVLFIGSLVFGESKAYAEQIKLLFATFEKENGFMVDGLKAFGKDLEKKSNGKVKVEFSWGEALGKTPEYYDLVSRGICDAAFCVPFHAKGLFPLSELTQLPWILPDSSKVGTPALFELYKRGYLDKAFDKDVKLLWIATSSGDPLFTIEKPVTTLADSKGLKVRTSGGLMNVRVEGIGGIPIFIPGPETYIALQKKIANGMIIGFGALPPFKLCEVIRYATIPEYGTVTFALLMNKKTYNNLPKDIQTIIDEMSANNEYGMVSARGWDKRISQGKECFLNHGGKIVEWTPSAMKELEERYAPIWKKWIDDGEARGLPTRKAIDEFYSLLRERGVGRPAIGYTPKM